MVTTLRISKKEKEREKEKEKDREREREREEKDREIKSIIQLHKLVAEQRVEEVKQLLNDPNIAR